MEAFTLKQLVFASKLMFPEDFQLLWEKHTGDANEARYITMLYKRQFKSNLFLFIHEYSDDDILEVLTKMIQDIIA